MQQAYRDLLTSMLADMETADPLYQPTYYWRLCSQRLIDDLDEYGLERFRASPSALRHFCPTYIFGDLAANKPAFEQLYNAIANVLPEKPKTHQWMDQFLTGEALAAADYRVYRASDQDRLPFINEVDESKVGDPLGQFEFEGRAFSRSMLNYLLGINFIKSQLGDIPCNNVLEIGGGFGTLGEILLSDSRNGSFYINVDIPPTAMFSSYYLEQVLGPDRVLSYTATRELVEIDIAQIRTPNSAAIFCPWQLPALQGVVDLFVNFISFQEMEPAVVSNYLKQVDRLQSRYVLLRNIREGREIAEKDGELGVKNPVRGIDYDDYLANYELVATNTIPYGFATVDGFHSELRLYARR